MTLRERYLKAVGGFRNFHEAARALQCSERNIRQKRDRERPVRYIDVLAAEAALKNLRSTDTTP